MIAGVVLAAGESSRLGSPKQLVKVSGQPLVSHAARCCAAGGCARVYVVLGASVERIRPVLRDLPVELLINDGWREGVASSIRTGIAALPEEAVAVLLVTCDQPRLSPALVRRLIAEFDGVPDRTVACAYGGTLGAPALFGRRRFGELLDLRGDRGARSLLRREPESVVAVAWPDGAFDVDLPADLGRI